MNETNRTRLNIPVTHPKPNINVTPLIDVLLVMLIIFMVLSPLRPARFLAKVPSQPASDSGITPNPNTLVVTIKTDHTLMLNGLADMGSVSDTSKLSATLVDLFQQRLLNHVYRDELRDRVDLPESLRIERTVFIKAPRSIPYLEVMKVMDGIKGAGAGPLGLQIDTLD